MKKYYKPFFSFLAVLLLILLYCILFNYSIKKDFKPKYYEYNSVVQIDSLKKIEKSDTLNLNKFVTRVDSIAEEICEIRNRYQEDINLMIYKSTHWMEFWLGLFTIAVGFLGFFHYFKIRKIDEDFHTLKEQYETKFATLEGQYETKFATLEGQYEAKFATLNGQNETNFSSHQEEEKGRINTIINEKFEGSNAQIKVLCTDLDKLSNTIKKSEIENRISTLMMCISSFPDPAMFNSSPKRKQHIKFYLKKLHNEFKEYIKVVEKEDMSDEELNRLSLALNSTKYVIIKTQSSFSSYHQNVTFNLLKNSINDILINIVETGNIPNDYAEHIDDILNKLNEIINNIEIGEGS